MSGRDLTLSQNENKLCVMSSIIKFEDLRLTPVEMRELAEGAAKYMVPPLDETEESEEIITKRELRE